MIPAKRNLTIRRGRDYIKDFVFQNADGELIDITTWSFVSEVRGTDCQSGTLLATFTIVVDVPTAMITLSLTDIETLAIPEGDAFWDLLVSIGDNDQSYMSGKIKSICTVTEVP